MAKAPLGSFSLPLLLLLLLLMTFIVFKAAHYYSDMQMLHSTTTN